MIDGIALAQITPAKLAPARDMAHRAVQIATKAARANLPAKADDSQSNLIWDRDRSAFFSQALEGKNGACSVGVSIADLTLLLTSGEGDIASTDLAGMSDDTAMSWLDYQLTNLGLSAAAPIVLPYDLPSSAGEIATFGMSDPTAFQSLAAWYALAENLFSNFAEANASIDPGPSPVRCWPHHFDIATYVSLEHGDFETAKGIGIGMSPGDESYAEPYFYVNPWPMLSPESLGPCPAPGHWHIEGFVGAIATATQALALDEPAEGLRSFIDGAFTSGRQALGA